MIKQIPMFSWENVCDKSRATNFIMRPLQRPAQRCPNFLEAGTNLITWRRTRVSISFQHFSMLARISLRVCIWNRQNAIWKQSRGPFL